METLPFQGVTVICVLVNCLTNGKGQLKASGLVCHWKDGTNLSKREIQMYQPYRIFVYGLFLNFKDSVFCFPALPENKGVWFKPFNWNQGEFDAIFLEKGILLVRFVQVTGVGNHSFKIEYFYSFLMALRQTSTNKQTIIDLKFLTLNLYHSVHREVY
jgi:hypothetical protein